MPFGVSLVPEMSIQASSISIDAEPRTNLAFVIHSMNLGGAERSIARLINALDHAKYRPIVICLSHTGPAAGWINSPEVPVMEMGRHGPFDRRAIRRLTRLLLDQKVDIIHSFNWGTLMEASLARRKARVAAHVHAERGTVLGGVKMRGIKMRLRAVCAAWAMKRCDAIVTNANSVAKRIEQRCGFAASKVHVIPNGVEPQSQPMSEQERDRRRGELGIPQNALVIGSVGRLSEVKGI